MGVEDSKVDKTYLSSPLSLPECTFSTKHMAVAGQIQYKLKNTIVFLLVETELSWSDK